MDQKSRSLSAAEFFESLQRDDLVAAVPVAFVGMVKKSDGKENTIQFALGEACSNWVTVPIEFIEDVEIIRTVPCKDHTHPLVRLNLKTPSNPEAKMYFSFIQGMQTLLNEMQPASAARQAVDEWGDPVCAPGTKKRCYPAVCPNPSGHGTIWCTKCQCEPVFNPHPEGFTPYPGF